MKFVLITANLKLAQAAERAGVGRIMVDLERLGKLERQGFSDTWISQHEVRDIAPMARAISTADLMVRINPLHDMSAQEIENVIGQGAKTIMLPMFNSIAELDEIAGMIDRRCRFVPLVETQSSFAIIGQVAKHQAVSETFIGLNDLHLSLGLNFMFEPLASGALEQACRVLEDIGKPYGFGGVARVGEGDLPGELIMQEHARLGSTRVNLSRTFARYDAGESIRSSESVFITEVRKLLAIYNASLNDTEEKRARSHAEVVQRINAIVERKRESVGL